MEQQGHLVATAARIGIQHHDRVVGMDQIDSSPRENLADLSICPPDSSDVAEKLQRIVGPPHPAPRTGHVTNRPSAGLVGEITIRTSQDRFPVVFVKACENRQCYTLGSTNKADPGNV
jgi:hypothetical protein